MYLDDPFDKSFSCVLQKWSATQASRMGRESWGVIAVLAFVSVTVCALQQDRVFCSVVNCAVSSFGAEEEDGAPLRHVPVQMLLWNPVLFGERVTVPSFGIHIVCRFFLAEQVSLQCKRPEDYQWWAAYFWWCVCILKGEVVKMKNQ